MVLASKFLTLLLASPKMGEDIELNDLPHQKVCTYYKILVNLYFHLSRMSDFHAEY